MNVPNGFASIDQLDKADAPPIPESYIYLLAVQCLVSLSEGLASFTAPLYASIVIQQRPTQSSPQRAPPALDLTDLPPSEISTKHLFIVRSIIESGWPALLAALSFIIATNLSDEIFVDVLTAYQALTNVSGMLSLNTPRDAFFTSLAKFAVPTLVVSSLNTYAEPPQTPRSATTALSEGLGLTGSVGPPGLSERNLACLKVLVGSAMFLAGSLGESWYGVLEVLQNADYVLTAKGAGPHGTPGKRGLFSPIGPGSSGIPASRSVSSSQAGSLVTPIARHPLLMDLDVETMESAIQRLFDASKNLEDAAFSAFVGALCRLSAEMVGMQSAGDGESVLDAGESLEDVNSSSGGGLTPKMDPAHRRRLSGIHIPKALVSFGCS